MMETPHNGRSQINNLALTSYLLLPSVSGGAIFPCNIGQEYVDTQHPNIPCELDTDTSVDFSPPTDPNNGFSAFKLDRCVFYGKQPDSLWIYIHVDDIALFGRRINSLREKISREFSIKDIGPADLLLGVNVHQLKDGIMLDQHHFVDSLLDAYGMPNFKAISTLLIPNKHLSVATEDEKAAFNKMKANFISAVGSINYLSLETLPELSHAGSSLSQHLKKPSVQNWKSFDYVLKYLCGTQ
ncbi:hypothetical protein O181_052691 [Austropuccinia psidii MF-1]|uniref:Reverse transcriptase Ty1/copia-type domain-containing protein n=1 Tax=Austropuccinia psidii MF-1 TaxID=1389203 RepID=A0A9Q3E633_9BASI|nr:hypothetical protein [Austropuccinia psidii MF-1]